MSVVFILGWSMVCGTMWTIGLLYNMKAFSEPELEAPSIVWLVASTLIIMAISAGGVRLIMYHMGDA